MDNGHEIGHELMAVTDQDGFIPGQIYYSPYPNAEPCNTRGEFITGPQACLLLHSVGLDQRSDSTPGPVSTWMGDRVRAGKPSRYVASQLGRLSLLPSVGW